MAVLTLGEQARLMRLSLDRSRRGLLARVLRSPLMRWRYGAPIADELLIMPQDLRTADPSFAAEIEQGHFGLAGRVAVLRGGHPFNFPPPSADWARELHGFSWLRHLKAAETEDGREAALTLVRAWISSTGRDADVAWEPAVIARRLISWVANGELLLDQVDQQTYDRTIDSLAGQLIHLSATWRDAPDGYPRLLALTALLFGDLCLAGHDHRLADIERTFSAEIARQILPDGGHIGRNPGVLIELLMDFLPLRQCFISRERPVPPSLERAIERMLAFTRFMRLGDSSIARFNGMGATPHDAVATVLAYGDADVELASDARASRYARLHHAGTTVIMDVGPPPPLALAAGAHAGCLSFELSSGTSAIFVNAGAPGPADAEWRATARSTAAHNTLCLDSKSSARLMRHPLLDRMCGDSPIRGPEDVRYRCHAADQGSRIEAAHDGYLKTTGLIHFRTLELSADGARLSGSERLGPSRGTLRLPQDMPYAIHFHLHPNVVCTLDGVVADLALRNGERWEFSAEGAAVSFEDSVHFADSSGPRTSCQIVLRGATHGETDVTWTLERRA